MRRLMMGLALCLAGALGQVTAAPEATHSKKDEFHRVWNQVINNWEESIQRKQARVDELNTREHNYDADQADTLADLTKSARQGIFKYLEGIGTDHGVFEAAENAIDEANSFREMKERDQEQLELVNPDGSLANERDRLRDEIREIKKNVELGRRYVEHVDQLDRARNSLESKLQDTKSATRLLERSTARATQERADVRMVQEIVTDPINAFRTQVSNVVENRRAQVQSETAAANGRAQAYTHRHTDAVYSAAQRSLNAFMNQGYDQSFGPGGPNDEARARNGEPSPPSRGVWDTPPPIGSTSLCPSSYVCSFTHESDRDWTIMMYWPEEYARRRAQQP